MWFSTGRCRWNSRSVDNVTQVVPFLGVSSMERSLRYYVDGLGFTIKNKWVVDGSVRWCWLAPHGKLGEGVSLCFQCEDAIAIYREVTSRGIEASEPQVGNALWDTTLSDPDGYRIHFASPTDTPEETKLSDVKG
jgi:lactoylglutathione lyase